MAIRQRPASWDWTSKSTSSREVAANRFEVVSVAPRVLVSWTPLTDRPSSTCVSMSAIRRCCLAVTSRRSRATLRVSQMAGGMTRRESRLSRQLRATMAMAVPTAVVTLDAMEVAVEVTTDCIPATSLVRRDWTSPPRVRVKNESDWR